MAEYPELWVDSKVLEAWELALSNVPYILNADDIEKDFPDKRPGDVILLNRVYVPRAGHGIFVKGVILRDERDHRDL